MESQVDQSEEQKQSQRSTKKVTKKGKKKTTKSQSQVQASNFKAAKTANQARQRKRQGLIQQTNQVLDESNITKQQVQIDIQNCDDDDEGDLNEDEDDLTVDLKFKLYEKHSQHNPLIRDKGSILNEDSSLSGKLEEDEEVSESEEDNEDDSYFMLSGQVKDVQSCHLNLPAQLQSESDIQQFSQSQAYHLGQEPQTDAQEKEGEVNIEKIQSPKNDSDEVNQFVLECESALQLTLRPSLEYSEKESHEEEKQDSSGRDIPSDLTSKKVLIQNSGDDISKVDYTKELNQLEKIESMYFFKKQSSSRIVVSREGEGQQPKYLSEDYIRTDTADFPMKLVTRGLIEEQTGSNQGDLGSNQEERNSSVQGTPRFPTEEEIEKEERKLLLTFALKDASEIEMYKREMKCIISQEFIVEQPPESKYKKLKYLLRRFEPSTKKTLVFCGIDALFLFSTQASIVRNFDKAVKIRKNGVKRKFRIFFRPHLYSFFKILSQHFELALYLSEEEIVARQWVQVLNSFADYDQRNTNSMPEAPIGKNEFQKQDHPLKSQIKRKKTITEKFFDIILTREHCIVDKQVKVACRNKDLLLEGRSIKDIIFIGCDLRESMLIHQNSIIVRPYHGNKYENTLAKLKIYLLKYFLDCNDVREIIRRDFLSHLKSNSTVQNYQSAISQKSGASFYKKNTANL